MAKQSALSVGTKTAFTPTRGTRIGNKIKNQAHQLSDEQRPLLDLVAKKLIKGSAYGKAAHAHRR
jgi:hypothetical protein